MGRDVEVYYPHIAVPGTFNTKQWLAIEGLNGSAPKYKGLSITIVVRAPQPPTGRG